MMVKVCGITRLEDARRSLRGGASALGFNFYPSSPRYLPPEKALPLLQALAGETLRVGVFVADTGLDPDWRETFRIVRPHLDAVQLHGLRGPEDVPETGLRTLVATTVERAAAFPGCEVLIDGSWGRGELADWSRLEQLEIPYVLAGGLDPGNVGEALRRLQPAGVDVCSGVESRPGRKSAARLKAFLAAVSEARIAREQPS